jgi:hypothetical protein
MKDLSSTTKLYILCIILIGFGLIVWMTMRLDWSNIWLYLLAALGAVAQTLKVEGPTNRTNYSIAWFVYGFTFIAFGVAATVFVILVSHLVEWLWHKYPWYIQAFNIGNHVITVCLAGLVFTSLNRGSQELNLTDALALAAANLTFVFVNHFLLAVVVKLARGQSFAESGLFEFLTLFLDFTVLSMGAVTALIWQVNPFASLLNILPLYLLYQALRVPALTRQLSNMKKTSA